MTMTETPPGSVRFDGVEKKYRRRHGAQKPRSGDRPGQTCDAAGAKRLRQDHDLAV